MDCNTASRFSPFFTLLVILEPVPTKKRSPLPWILGGCAVLFLCATLALAANAVFWVTRTHGASANANPPPAPGGIQAALEALPEGDPNSGERIFREVENCQACHSVNSNQRGAKPGKAGLFSGDVPVRIDPQKPLSPL